MHAFSIEATREDQSAKIILKAASQEISQLHTLIEDLQSTALFRQEIDLSHSASDIAVIQSLDYITQSLFVLSNVMSEAAEQSPSDWLFDGLKSIEDIKLKALKDRFNGVDVPPVNSAEIGKCDFF